MLPASLKANHGAALPEVVIAILILVSGSISALSLMNSILKLAVASNNRIIAVNLAREGIEAMRSVRDTNWLYFSGSQRDTSDETRDHWNDGFDCVPIVDPWCVAPVTMRLRVYLDRFDSDGDPGTPDDLRWSVDAYDAAEQSDDPDTIAAGDYYRLYLDDTLDLAPLPNQNIYNCSDPTLCTPLEATQFYRQIKITYQESYDGGAGTGDVNDNVVEVESKVFWKEGSDVRELELTTVLTDWFGRSDHNA